MEKEKDRTSQDSDSAKKAYKKEQKRVRNYERMVLHSKEKRDLWIGHKLGNVITDVKIGGKDSMNEAALI